LRRESFATNACATRPLNQYEPPSFKSEYVDDPPVHVALATLVGRQSTREGEEDSGVLVIEVVLVPGQSIRLDLQLVCEPAIRRDLTERKVLVLEWKH
jgi:hypothetical protein